MHAHIPIKHFLFLYFLDVFKSIMLQIENIYKIFIHSTISFYINCLFLKIFNEDFETLSNIV